MIKWLVIGAGVAFVLYGVTRTKRANPGISIAGASAKWFGSLVGADCGCKGAAPVEFKVPGMTTESIIPDAAVRFKETGMGAKKGFF